MFQKIVFVALVVMLLTGCSGQPYQDVPELIAGKSILTDGEVVYYSPSEPAGIVTVRKYASTDALGTMEGTPLKTWAKYQVVEDGKVRLTVWITSGNILYYMYRDGILYEVPFTPDSAFLQEKFIVVFDEFGKGFIYWTQNFNEPPPKGDVSA